MGLQVNDLDWTQLGGFSDPCWAHSHGYRQMCLHNGVALSHALCPGKGNWTLLHEVSHLSGG